LRRVAAAIKDSLAKKVAGLESVIAKDRQAETASHGKFSQVYFFLPSIVRASLQTVLTAARSLLVAFS
jgi:hypothetical protein